MTPQPSPTNLSDELNRTLKGMLLHYKARWNVSGVYENGPPDLDWCEAKAAITAAYAEAIRSAVPEKKDPQARHLFETDNGTMVDTVLPPYINGFNAAIDTMLDNLKKKGLLPANASDEGGVK